MSDAVSVIAAEFESLIQRLEECVQNGEPEKKRLGELSIVLAQLLAVAASLPETNPAETELAWTQHRTGRAEVERAFPSLGLYWMVLDPLQPESGEPVVGDAIDDLIDVLDELGKGSTFVERCRSTAIWHWKRSFEAHWGRHAVSLLSVAARTLASWTELGRTRTVRD